MWITYPPPPQKKIILCDFWDFRILVSKKLWITFLQVFTIFAEKVGQKRDIFFPSVIIRGGGKIFIFYNFINRKIPF